MPMFQLLSELGCYGTQTSEEIKCNLLCIVVASLFRKGRVHGWDEVEGREGGERLEEGGEEGNRGGEEVEKEGGGKGGRGGGGRLKQTYSEGVKA